jgi:hypothetical protein
MMNIGMKQLTARACLALGLVMSNARSMDAFTPPLPSAANTAARLAQMHAAAHSLMSANGTFTSFQTVQYAAQLFAGDIIKFSVLLSRILAVANSAIHAGTIGPNGTIGMDRVLCMRNSQRDLDRWTCNTDNPIREELERGLTDIRDGGSQALSEETRILAQVVGHTKGKVPTIVFHFPYNRSKNVDLIAVKSNKNGRWELFFLTCGDNYPGIAYAAYTGATPANMTSQRFGECLDQRIATLSELHGRPETLQQAERNARTLGGWVCQVAQASMDVKRIACDVLRQSGDYPAESEDTRRQLWIVR